MSVPKGRRPKPTALKVLEGNPGKRRLPVGEPKPVRGQPPVPVDVSAPAVEFFRRVCSELDAMNVLSRADVFALEQVTRAWEAFEAARRELAVFVGETGSQYYQVGTNGAWARHPAVADLRAADKDLKAWLIELGLTPAARTRVKVVGDGEAEDDLLS